VIRDVDLARKRLMAAGVRDIGEASQFRDIGYLTHLSDLAGAVPVPFASGFYLSPLDPDPYRYIIYRTDQELDPSALKLITSKF